MSRPHVVGYILCDLFRTILWGDRLGLSVVDELHSPVSLFCLVIKHCAHGGEQSHTLGQRLNYHLLLRCTDSIIYLFTSNVFCIPIQVYRDIGQMQVRMRSTGGQSQMLTNSEWLLSTQAQKAPWACSSPLINCIYYFFKCIISHPIFICGYKANRRNI